MIEYILLCYVMSSAVTKYHECKTAESIVRYGKQFCVTWIMSMNCVPLSNLLKVNLMFVSLSNT